MGSTDTGGGICKEVEACSQAPDETDQPSGFLLVALFAARCGYVPMRAAKVVMSCKAEPENAKPPASWIVGGIPGGGWNWWAWEEAVRTKGGMSGVNRDKGPLETGERGGPPTWGSQAAGTSRVCAIAVASKPA